MELRALIVDDEPLGREAIRTLLARDPRVTEIFEAANGTDAIERIREGCANLIFLDVEMPDLDGFSVLRLTGLEQTPAVVFVTAHEEYAVEAFERNAIDYLLKPVAAARFARMLDRVRSRLEAGNASKLHQRLVDHLEAWPAPRAYLDRIAVKLREKTILINTEDVDWIQAADDYAELHIGQLRYLLNANLTKLASRLDPRLFVRIHRSILVNMRSIKELRPVLHGEYAIILHNGVHLRSGRTYHDTVKSLISNSF
jgi:two-component system LytT family response regulator